MGDWGAVIGRYIDFLLRLCYNIDMISNKAIREGNVVEYNGEIVHPHDAGIFEEVPPTDEERHEAALAAYEAEQQTIATIRGSAEFSARNQYLSRLAKRVGEANQHQGAANSMYSGGYVPRYTSPEHAESLEVDALRQARQLGRRACESCPLVKYCPIAELPDELIHSLKDAKTRGRFRRRVEADSDRFCETNMKPGRLDSNQA